MQKGEEQSQMQEPCSSRMKATKCLSARLQREETSQREEKQCFPFPAKAQGHRTEGGHCPKGPKKCLSS